VELPTYTNIWKIEKRLYKLYDFRLPMPVPVGQVTAFLAIAIPYMLILTMAGMPFSHTWVWLYLLPPGVLAWLVTRPVLEGKRLPELVASQLRYLSEPRTWCRMAPLAERDQIVVSATVWRSPAARTRPAAAVFDPARAESDAVRADRARPDARSDDSPADARPPAKPLVDADEALGLRAHARARAGASLPAQAPVVVRSEAGPVGAGKPAQATRPVWPTQPAIAQRPVAATPTSEPAPIPHPRAKNPTAPDSAPPSQAAQSPVSGRAAAPSPVAPSAAGEAPVPPNLVPPNPVASKPAAPVPPTAAQLPVVRPTLTVRAAGPASRSLPPVERALQKAPEDRPRGWHERVVVVPGGHRPGKPDQLERDQARARMPLSGAARIVVLGCSAGAGQTTTTLLTGQLLASLRGEAVAVLDIGSGPGSLTELARHVPRLLPDHRDRSGAAAGPGRERGLQVVTAEAPAEAAPDAGRLIDAVVARYQITIADPAAPHVPRAVQAADQLVLVARASADAAGAIAMTLEWLEAHGNADLARGAVTVLNGVSTATAAHVDKAAGVAAGRCRAIVRVPSDDRLAHGSAVGIATVQAFTALSGVIIAGLARPVGADMGTGAVRS
jgi:hypothetical protein